MNFWKVYKRDIPDLKLVLPVRYKKIFSPTNSRFKILVLDEDISFFFICRTKEIDGFQWSWMPEIHNGKKSYDYFIERGYTYKGEFARLLKIKKLKAV